ncbi:MAG: hybrid sensor histidine kinase/response regulator, partial [Acidobacteria bacterium]
IKAHELTFGGVAAGLALVTDVTERLRAEDALRRSEEKYRSLLAHVPDVTWTSDSEGVTPFISPNVEKVCGFNAEEVCRRPEELWFGRIHPDDLERVFKSYRSLFKGDGVFDVEYRYRRMDGEWIWLHDRAIATYEKDGRAYADGMFTDVTERKEIEERLLQSQRMESVGRLAGGVAHDFNNLLTVVNGYSDLALRRLKDGDPLRRTVEEIRRAGERAARLTRQLLAFSRKQILQPKTLDLNALVSESGKMLRRVIGEDVEIVLALRPDLWKVRVDPAQLDQVLVNLAVNSRDAMPSGGTLSVVTDNVNVGAEGARRAAPTQDGPHVLLKVSDTGCGMDAETMARVFEPFFTTKETGKGTGLGLSTVYGIIQQSGGFITVESEVGHGTTFSVYLPCTGEEAERESHGRDAEPGLPCGSETILLVEDEDIVRKMTRNILEECGYEVLTASNGREALEVGASHGGAIDLLLTDVVMPQMGGRRLAEHMKVSHPRTRVLYMSGYTDDAILRHGVLEETAAFMEKPFSPEVLARKVREVLDA